MLHYVVPAMQRRASGGPYSEPSPGNHSVRPWARQFSGLPVQVDPWLQQSSRCGPMGIILTAAAVKHQTHGKHEANGLLSRLQSV